MEKKSHSVETQKMDNANMEKRNAGLFIKVKKYLKKMNMKLNMKMNMKMSMKMHMKMKMKRIM